jgi:thiamine-phosphate diphosphorylase
MVTPAGIVVLTDRRLAAGPPAEVVAAAVAGGASWVVLRERDLGYADRCALAAALRDVVPPERLIVAGPDPLGGDAVHLSRSDPWPESPVRMVGRSCHDAGELARLSGEDYVTLSPVFPTTTKPGYGPALTPEGAARLAPSVPWLALGGVDSAERARRCGAAGAAGIAVLGAVMRAADPERVVRELASAFAAGAAGAAVAAGAAGAAGAAEAAVEVGA